MSYFRLRPIAASAAVVGILVTVLLGNWQRHKADRRTDLQAQIVSAENDAPLPIAGGTDDPLHLLWHRVEAHGTWQPADVVYLDNRPDQGRVGLYVIMPLKLDDGSVLLVNRGWLPRNIQDRTRIAPYETPAGRITVVGLALANEDRFLELARPPALKTGTIWENFDFDAFAHASGLTPLRCIVREDAGAADGLERSWPDRGSVFERQIERNRGYAFQWYAMSAAIVGLCLFYGIRNARHDRSPQP